jgi:uncharacterized membrane protein YccC
LIIFGSRIKIPTIDYDAWIYALRAASAGCLAQYISFSLNLDGSHWALTTCYIVGSERQSGRRLAKSVARIVGTLVGIVASFTLVNCFAHERVLFICCFAARLSICAYFSHYQREHWAYAWVLAGYTTAIVGVPASSSHRIPLRQCGRSSEGRSARPCRLILSHSISCQPWTGSPCSFWLYFLFSSLA